MGQVQKTDTTRIVFLNSKMEKTIEKIVDGYLKFADNWNNNYAETNSKSKKAVAGLAIAGWILGIPMIGYAIDKYLLHGNGDNGAKIAMLIPNTLMLTLSALGKYKLNHQKI